MDGDGELRVDGEDTVDGAVDSMTAGSAMAGGVEESLPFNGSADGLRSAAVDTVVGDLLSLGDGGRLPVPSSIP